MPTAHHRAVTLVDRAVDPVAVGSPPARLLGEPPGPESGSRWTVAPNGVGVPSGRQEKRGRSRPACHPPPATCATRTRHPPPALRRPTTGGRETAGQPPASARAARLRRLPWPPATRRRGPPAATDTSCSGSPLGRATRPLSQEVTMLHHPHPGACADHQPSPRLDLSPPSADRNHAVRVAARVAARVAVGVSPHLDTVTATDPLMPASPQHTPPAPTTAAAPKDPRGSSACRGWR